MWNCNSSIFLFSFSELKNPALRCEKAESSGAKIVNPPLFADMSCEFRLSTICVVLRRRVRIVNVFAFLRIFVMSSGVESEVSGNVGTNGFVDVGDAAFGAGACFGDAACAGAVAVAVAAMLGEYNEENMSRKSEKEKII